AQVPVEGAFVAQVQEPPAHPKERVLHQVLGQRPVTGEQRGEADRLGRVPEVELLEQAPLAPHRLHGHSHHAWETTESLHRFRRRRNPSMEPNTAAPRFPPEPLTGREGRWPYVRVRGSTPSRGSPRSS